MTVLAARVQHFALRPFVWTGRLFAGFWRFIHWIFSPFRSIPFKMALRYMAVSTTVALLIEAAVIAYVGFFTFDTTSQCRAIESATTRSAGILADSAASSPANPAALSLKLDGSLEQARHSLYCPWYVITQPTLTAAIIDGQGRILAGAPGNPYAIGSQLTTQIDDEDASPVRAVLNAGPRSACVSRQSRTGNLVSAMPLLDIHKKPQGYLVLMSSLHMNYADYVQDGLRAGAMSIPVLLAINGITGLLFGVISARSLRRRLRGLSLATDAWGAGDFSVTAPERPDDELGQLARRLNGMTESLRGHIRAQQRVAALEERTRLARDLHDTVKQQAFAAAMQLGAARTVLAENSGPAGVFVAQAEKLINKIQEDLMTIIHELRPESVAASAQTLGERLRDDVYDWVNTANVQAVVQVDPAIDASPAVSQALLRITHEALANVARHSGAAQVTVTLEPLTPGVAQLTISDDGLGFDAEAAMRGIGLGSMRDRALSLPGGRFSLETHPGFGVRIRVSCLTGGDDAPTH